MLFRIFKMIATSGFLTALECCTKFAFGQELTALPNLLAGLRGVLLRGKGAKGREERREGRERKKRGRKGERAPLTRIPGFAPVQCSTIRAEVCDKQLAEVAYTFKYRRYRADMIQTYKILNKLYDERV